MEWISVEDGLPRHNKTEVLVKRRFQGLERYSVSDTIAVGYMDGMTWYAPFPVDDVVAWMPKPKDSPMPSPEPQNGTALPPLDITEGDIAGAEMRVEDERWYPRFKDAAVQMYTLTECRERQLWKALQQLAQAHETAKAALLTFAAQQIAAVEIGSGGKTMSARELLNALTAMPIAALVKEYSAKP